MATEYIKYDKKREKFFLNIKEALPFFGQGVATPMLSVNF